MIYYFSIRTYFITIHKNSQQINIILSIITINHHNYVIKVCVFCHLLFNIIAIIYKFGVKVWSFGFSAVDRVLFSVLFDVFFMT